MTTLVVGASGATGRLLVEQLLERGEYVRVIVRSHEGSQERRQLMNRWTADSPPGITGSVGRTTTMVFGWQANRNRSGIGTLSIH